MSLIEKRVREIIVEQLGVDESNVRCESNLTDDLGADELDIMELILQFEREFAIGLPDDFFEDRITVGDIIDYIEVCGSESTINVNDVNKVKENVDVKYIGKTFLKGVAKGVGVALGTDIYENLS